MWSGPEANIDQIWRANHFVPFLSISKPESIIETASSIQILNNNTEHIEAKKIRTQAGLRSNRPIITYTSQIEDEKENNSRTQNFQEISDKRHIFMDTPAIIQHMINAYSILNQENIKNLQLKPHGNAKNSNRPFTSTLPSVLEQIKAQPRFVKPSAIYNSSINNVEQSPLAPLTTIRDRVQIYNARARQKNDSNVEEYLTILKNLEKSDTIIARFSMNRNAAPTLVLAQPYIIQEMKRCCVNPPDQVAASVLCKFHFLLFI
ncbi:unnamed protein product [Adineta steineri]|uniref:Uncharacterized protein n=1 Tax=Adineta steineri TaxID=433720 RepID=A0A813M438_9BILA|nr:unnamed protein product [Adineta steineri]CAF4027695.1 unnamed protein product [Adineta steineri]